ncbi:1,4-dihydroxy-2-naphthoate octaprenyltransferase [Geodermatophilus bullaregiensis]|uniref:prenyltransferase n=1 Tax=Geodermatophilus bullaregiensis TaxID=1564160 RepID=UPI00195D9B71|nr:prenyltransferase [Geodermatophilus bullaregiensis]MBM7808025.1 1,4-dihydroxy-2-naphthoate octaprenyltransferase [Geodermatophilus bullaregiensis]
MIQPQFFHLSAWSVVLGTVIAYVEFASLDFATFLFSLGSIACIHAGVNSANEYFDYLSGADLAVTEDMRFGGGTRVLPSGRLQPRTVLVASMVCFAVGAAMGMFVVVRTTFWVLLLGVLGASLGYFYTAPPLKLAYRALGELFVGLAFGPLMVLGAVYSQASQVGWGAIAVSLTVGLLNAAAIVCHRFPDAEPDALTGKRTLVVVLGKDASRWVVATLLWISPVPPVISYFLGVVPGPVAVLAGLTVPAVLLLGLRFIERFTDKRAVERVGTRIMTLLSTVPAGFSAAYFAAKAFGW